MPFGYTTSESRPSGSSHTRCVRFGNRSYLDSSEGQYRGEGGTNRREEEKEEEEEESASIGGDSDADSDADSPTPVPARSYADLGCALTNASVSSVVLVDAHAICLAAGSHRRFPLAAAWEAAANSKGVGSASPGCRSSRSHAIVRASSLGGVPVFMRPIRKPRRYSVAARRFAPAEATRSGPEEEAEAEAEASEGRRPAGNDREPTWTTPLRNVPVVMTTAGARRTTPERSVAPRTTPLRCVVGAGASEASARFVSGRTETGST